jgi:Fur family zinc uptake transcriptional regulator
MKNKNILEIATRYCEEHKERLTQPRLEVLRVISDSTKPLGAYDVLKGLSTKIENPKPPTAYRAIEFWEKHGFVHKIASLNAYVSCSAGHQHKGSQFLICDLCESVIETHICNLPDQLEESALSKKFTPQRWNLEIYGTCEQCLGH